MTRNRIEREGKVKMTKRQSRNTECEWEREENGRGLRK